MNIRDQYKKIDDYLNNLSFLKMMMFSLIVVVIFTPMMIYFVNKKYENFDQYCQKLEISKNFKYHESFHTKKFCAYGNTPGEYEAFSPKLEIIDGWNLSKNFKEN